MEDWEQRLRDAIAQVPGQLEADPGDDPNDPRPEGSVLIAWVVVAEWLTLDDGFVLQRVSAEGQSPSMTTGLLTDALDT